MDRDTADEIQAALAGAQAHLETVAGLLDGAGESNHGDTAGNLAARVQELAADLPHDIDDYNAFD